MSLGSISILQTGSPFPGVGLDKRLRLAGRCGFSLIEIIAVLAILCILVAAVLPVAVRQIDYVTESTEETNLVAMAEGFTKAVLARRQIPDTNYWDVFIATNIGWQVAAVRTNVRNNARVFLINPATPNIPLPYQQSSSGWFTPPANAQFMILSSLSSPLPRLVSSDFSVLWNTPKDKIPVGTSSSFNGRGDDLKIQRINLASSFSHQVLNNLDFANAFFAIDLALNNVVKGRPIDTYFLKGTVLNLYYQSNFLSTLQSSQVLQKDASWYFCNGLWRDTPCPVALSGLEGVVQSFYNNVPHNTGNPVFVYNDMTNYMALYLQYAATGFLDPITRLQLQTAGTNLNTAVQNLAQ